MLPRTNLNEQVYETLRQRVLRRDPGPGAKLSLHELATELGVSRSPVHHALTRLVSEGPALGQGAPRLLRHAGDGEDRRSTGTTCGSRSSCTRPSAAVGSVDAPELDRFRALMVESEAAISQEEWDAANAAFHEFQIDLAGERDALPRLSRAVRQPDDAGDPRRHARGRRVPRARAPRDRGRLRRPATCRPPSRRSGRTSSRARASRSTRSSAPAACSSSEHDRSTGPPGDRARIEGWRAPPTAHARLRPRGEAALPRGRRAGRGAPPPGTFPFTRGRIRTCTAAGRGRSASTPASRRRRSRTSATAICSRGARRGSRSRSTCRRSSASTRTTRWPRARSGARASRSTRSPTWRCCSNGIPLDEVSTSMTINAPAALLLLLYELVAEQQGVPGTRAARHGAERHPQGVRRARELHLPAAAVDAADDGPVRLLRGAHPALEHDLDLRLPHPRGGLDRRAGARVHARERDRLLRGGRRGGPLARCVRRPALVLLQRAQRLLPGGREVPGRPHAVGADHARPLRRHDRAGAGAALPRADGRLDAHRPTTREQHRQSCRAGTLGRLWRRAVAPHEQLRRGARAAERARGDDRAAHPAGPDARGRHDRHGRSARRLATTSRRSPRISSSARPS